MLGLARLDRIASGLAIAVTLMVGPTSLTWGQGAVSTSPTVPPPAAQRGAETTAGAALIAFFFAAVVVAIVIIGRYVATRRMRLEEAAIIQARVSDALAREIPLRGLVIAANARIRVWRGSPVTIEVSGNVPTPELRETVMRLVRKEAAGIRSDVVAEDHLFVVPEMHRAS